MMGHAIAAATLLASACEALPESAGHTATPTDTQFKAILNAAAVPDNPSAEDRNLTALLARTEITLDQRLQVLVMRAGRILVFRRRLSTRSA